MIGTKINTKTGYFNADDVETNPNVFSIDLGNYMLKSAPVIEDDNELYLKGSAVINFHGTKQVNAYSELERGKVDLTNTKLTNYTYDNGVTKINNDLDLLDANLLISDESIPKSRIIGLVDKLTEIDDNLNSINNNDAEILSNATNIMNNVNTINDLSDNVLTNTNNINLNLLGIY
jgi:hypothetical protein